MRIYRDSLEYGQIEIELTKRELWQAYDEYEKIAYMQTLKTLRNSMGCIVQQMNLWKKHIRNICLSWKTGTRKLTDVCKPS